MSSEGGSGAAAAAAAAAADIPDAPDMDEGKVAETYRKLLEEVRGGRGLCHSAYCCVRTDGLLRCSSCAASTT